MNANTFPIRILSEKTGVPTATIRAWERRYNVLPAQRTASGHRHYNDEDAVYVSHLVACMEQGMTISKAIREVDNQLQQGQRLTAQARNTQSSQWQYYVDEMLLSVAQFDLTRLDQAYQQAMGLFAVDAVTEQVLCPTLATLGERWQDRAAGIAEEHFFTSYLRNKIGARLHHHPDSLGSIIIVACMPGERHDLGSMLFALYAQNKGYRVISLGADMPIEQLPAVTSQSGARGIVLSSTAGQLPIEEIHQLLTLVKHTDVPIMLGGPASLVQGNKFAGLVMLGTQFRSAIDCLLVQVP